MAGARVGVIAVLGLAATASTTHRDVQNCHGAVVTTSVHAFGNVPAAVDFSVTEGYPFDSLKGAQHFIRELCRPHRTVSHAHTEEGSSWS